MCRAAAATLRSPPHGAGASFLGICGRIWLYFKHLATKHREEQPTSHRQATSNPRQPTPRRATARRSKRATANTTDGNRQPPRHHEQRPNVMRTATTATSTAQRSRHQEQHPQRIRTAPTRATTARHLVIYIKDGEPPDVSHNQRQPIRKPPPLPLSYSFVLFRYF